MEIEKTDVSHTTGKAWYEVYLSSDDKSGKNVEGTHPEAVCNTLEKAIIDLEKLQNKNPDKHYYIDHWTEKGLDEEFQYISKKEIHDTCDDIRNNCNDNNVMDMIANYIEANIDEFMDCYNTDVE